MTPGFKDDSDMRPVESRSERVQIGPFRGLRMKKTALGGIKDHNDTRHVELRMTMTRASWSDTGADRSF